MSYTFRPKSDKDIDSLTSKNLNNRKKKTIKDLFNTLKNLFKDEDEFITIDIILGKVKILSKFKNKIDLEDYKKRFKDIGLKFGDGTNPKTDKPTTAQQERVTLKIFEEVLSKSTPNYKTFEELLPLLMNIYPKLSNDSDWYKSFKLQFDDLDKATDLPKNNFDVYNRDGGFMNFITKKVNSGLDGYKIAKKDSWDPADIWLIRSNKFSKYEKLLEDAVNLFEVNDILKDAFNNNIIVGISLKKNNGKKLYYEKVNLKADEKFKFASWHAYDINVEYNSKTKKFTSLSSKISIKFENNLYNMRIGSNSSGLGNIVYEFYGKNSEAALGKIPLDFLKKELSENNFSLPTHNTFSKFNKALLKKSINIIKQKKSLFNIKGDIDKFMENMEESWTLGNIKENNIISQIIVFASIIASFPKNERDNLLTKLFYLSQKKGKEFGPFGKLA